MRQKPLFDIKISGLDPKSERLLEMFICEVGTSPCAEDTGVMKSVLRPDLKKVTTFVKLLGGEVEILETRYVSTF